MEGVPNLLTTDRQNNNTRSNCYLNMLLVLCRNGRNLEESDF